MAFLLAMHYVLLFFAIYWIPRSYFFFPLDYPAPTEGRGWFYMGVCAWELLTIIGTIWIAWREGTAASQRRQ